MNMNRYSPHAHPSPSTKSKRHWPTPCIELQPGKQRRRVAAGADPLWSVSWWRPTHAAESPVTSTTYYMRQPYEKCYSTYFTSVTKHSPLKNDRTKVYSSCFTRHKRKHLHNDRTKTILVFPVKSAVSCTMTEDVITPLCFTHQKHSLKKTKVMLN